MMCPGEYLRKRRQATGLGLRQAAATLAAFPWAVGKPGFLAIRRAERALEAAESGTAHLTLPRAELLANVVRLDPRIYIRLVNIELGSPEAHAPPQLCRSCACSWCDPCAHADGTACAWLEPDLCTACAEKEEPLEILRMPSGFTPTIVTGDAA